jgi:hypothetical protein
LPLVFDKVLGLKMVGEGGVFLCGAALVADVEPRS